MATEPTSGGWQPIEQMPEGHCLMWVENSGYALGFVSVYPDGARYYRAAMHAGDWNVTHGMPLPAPPSSPAGDAHG